jgi:iron complex transport system permease protein
VVHPSEPTGAPAGSRGSPGAVRFRAHRPTRVLIVLLAALLGATVASLAVGPVAIPPGNLVYLLAHRLGLLATASCPTPLVVDGTSVSCSIQAQILFQALMPVVLLSLLVGASLALAGATMQGLFRNPLADPYLLGISSGAALGAALVFVDASFLGITLRASQQNVLIPLLAFFGAMGTGFVVLLASHSRWATAETMILTGVALAAILGDIMVLVVSLRPLAVTVPLTFWLLGGFGAATWGQVGVLAAVLVVAGAALILHGRVLNVLQMGEETAAGLGVSVAAIRRRLILLSVVLTATAVAFSGVIGFIGLVSPHIVRRIQGPSYQTLLPASALVGALLLVVANDVATTVLGGGGILPVGVVTGVMGGPFILYLLYRRRSHAGPT